MIRIRFNRLMLTVKCHSSSKSIGGSAPGSGVLIASKLFVESLANQSIIVRPSKRRGGQSVDAAKVALICRLLV